MREVAWAAARMVPLALAGPFGPPSARLIVGVALSLAVAPAASGAVSSLPWALVAAREVAAGLVLGLFVSLIAGAARAAGALVDEARRAGAADGALGRLQPLLAMALFSSLGGPALLVDGIARGYEALPLGAATGAGGAAATIAAGGVLVTSAVELAAPVLAAMLLAELVVALVARAAPSLARHAAVGDAGVVRELSAVAASALALGATALLVAAQIGRLSTTLGGVGRTLGGP